MVLERCLTEDENFAERDVGAEDVKSFASTSGLTNSMMSFEVFRQSGEHCEKQV
jgi:hypothetical protein